jgi:polyphosphate kinase 2
MTENAGSTKREAPDDERRPAPGVAPAAESARLDPTDAVASEGMADAPAVVVNGVKVDLDDLELPKPIREGALTSGGYPFDSTFGDKPYERALLPLQIELLKLQSWVKAKGERIVLVFEGRDGSGKGGAIKTITRHLNPRTVRVVALSKRSSAEEGEWYFQRYLRQMPTAGEIVLFDRSWYNRAGVEPVMGFASPAETSAFLTEAPQIERLLVGDGIRMFKFWLTIGREMQIKRLHARRHDPLKRWKLSPIDYAGLSLWNAYSDAADQMLGETHTDFAPWTVVRANDKRRLRLATIRRVLLSVPYAGRDLAAIGANDDRVCMEAPAFLALGGES